MLEGDPQIGVHHIRTTCRKQWDSISASRCRPCPGSNCLIPALPYLDFLNINELEWGESNAYHMRERGYELADELHNAIDGAKGWAEELCRHEKVHWCSSAFKDSVQLRERLKRVAHNTARPFDEITDDGTIVYGVFEPVSGSTGTVASFFLERFEPDSYSVFPERVEMAWWLLEKHADDTGREKIRYRTVSQRGYDRGDDPPVIGRRLIDPLYERYLRMQCRHVPNHIAIIQDGNRRYAKMLGIDTASGHRAGADKTEEMLDWAHELGIRHITLYTFSTENFSRNQDEVKHLFELFKEKFSLVVQDERVKKYRIRVQMVGDRSRLPADLRDVIDSVEAATRDL